MGLSKKTPIAAKEALIQMSSLVAVAMALYSASAEERETIPCFLVFQATGDPPRVTRHPVGERLVMGHAPQSESQNAYTCKFELCCNKMPWQDSLLNKVVPFSRHPCALLLDFA